MSHQLPLDDRATCAELFDFACALADALRKLAPYTQADLLARFEALRDDITQGENT